MSTEDRKWPLFDDHSSYIDRFGLLLIVTTLAVVTLSLVDLRGIQNDLGSEIAQLAVSLFVGATLLLALRAGGVGRRLRIIADVLISIGVLATLAVVVATALSDSPASEVSGAPVVWTVLAALAPLVVLRRLLQHDRASGATLLGAVSAYLLIALAFNFAFLTIEVYESITFFGEPEPTTSFMYYSLVTVTTLGYGDLAAVTPLGRLLSTIEAVIGQVYLVTFVAMIVGLIVGQRQRSRSRD